MKLSVLYISLDQMDWADSFCVKPGMKCKWRRTSVNLLFVSCRMWCEFIRDVVMAYSIVSKVLVCAFDFTFLTKSLAYLHRVNVNLCWDVLRLSVRVIISIVSLFWFESQVDFWSLGECASALTSKPWFVRIFEYRIQCSHAADSADRCGQLVRIRPAKTKASGTRWKAAQTTPVFCLLQCKYGK